MKPIALYEGHTDLVGYPELLLAHWKTGEPFPEDPQILVNLAKARWYERYQTLMKKQFREMK